jgi:aspartyl-tRNA(Asn)/glutamyl-tRNA(Gln) amidotransferase subunit A
MVDELPWQTLTELAHRSASGQVSSREIVAACFDNIDARDGKLHAFVDVWRDDALAQADALDRERRAGHLRGPLHGLPIALKDLLHVAGRQTTAGAKSWRGQVSDHTATAVTRLVAAGMIPLGKTHMVEFALAGAATSRWARRGIPGTRTHTASPEGRRADRPSRWPPV